MSNIKILLIDDHTLFRESVARLLASEPDFEVVGHCALLDQAFEIIRSKPVDIVLLDPDLGDERGVAFFASARQMGFTGRVLVVTGGMSDQEATEMVSRGAAGIFMKHHPPGLLAKSIRKIFEGEMWLDQTWVQNLLKQARSGQGQPRARSFTPRELDVLRGVLEGMSNKEIGARLGVSETAVKASMQQLFHKTGVRTRSQLVRVALEHYRDQI